MKYEAHKLETIQQQEMNSLLLERASDISEALTKLTCEKNNIKCYNEGDNTCMTYTDEAQEIFNAYYDHYTEELYKLANSIVKIDNERIIETLIFINEAIKTDHHLLINEGTPIHSRIVRLINESK